MGAISSEPINPALDAETNEIRWTRRLNPPKDEHCGQMVYRAHDEARSGQRHVTAFRHSDGDIRCCVCHDQVALREALKVDRRLSRAHHLLEKDGNPRVPLLLNIRPRYSSEDWWPEKTSYIEVRARMARQLAAIGMEAWVAVFHCQDDRSERDPLWPLGPCPWTGHWHVYGYGHVHFDAESQLHWTIQKTAVGVDDAPVHASPVEVLSHLLSDLSSWPYRRSIQRTTYGGLAAPGVQVKRGLPKMPGKRSGMRCGACDQEIPRSEWFRTIPPPDFIPGNDIHWIVDPREWPMEITEEVGYGPPRRRWI